MCQWWAEFAHPGWNRVKVSENLGATAVAPVAPVVTSLRLQDGHVHVSFEISMHNDEIFALEPIHDSDES